MIDDICFIHDHQLSEINMFINFKKILAKEKIEAGAVTIVAITIIIINVVALKKSGYQMSKKKRQTSLMEFQKMSSKK